MGVIQRPSPNHNERPAGVSPSLIVVHGTAGSSVGGDVAWLTDKARRPEGGVYDTSLSYHYVIGRAGEVYQLVDESRRAWHAGKSNWNGKDDVNDFSIGIGLTNRGPVDGDPAKPGAEPYPSAQLLACASLLVDICGRRSIPWYRIVSHAEVSPGRKHDPWLHFPWMELSAGMLSYQRIREGQIEVDRVRRG